LPERRKKIKFPLISKKEIRELMIVPRYWSESKAKKIVNGKIFTVKRFGWSDESESKAKEHADERLSQALEELQAKGDVRRIDHKVSYNGAEGIPIREEVISKYGDVVISRNSYGALCLNTPDVLFADIDFEFDAPSKLSFITFLILAIFSAIFSFAASSWIVLLVAGFLSAVFSTQIADSIHKRKVDKEGGFEQKALYKVQSLIDDNADLNLHVYKTPNGLRVLFLNATYSPKSDEAIRFLGLLDSDKTYIQMCKNQNCFRARVSPKPWRVGLGRLRPTPGVWPIKQEWMEERASWVQNYEQISQSYASCRFIKSVGSNQVDEKAEQVKQLHDELCQANHSGLELA